MPEVITAWGEGWLWLIGSLLAAVLGVNTAWLFRRSRLGAVSEFGARLAAWRLSPLLLQILRLIYYVGVPFAALLWGHDAAVGRLLGLQQLDLPTSGGAEASTIITTNWLDWAYDVGWAAALGVGAWGLLALAWWTCRRALVPGGEAGMAAAVDVSGWVLLREAAYHEIHWAFYRNAPILEWGSYWGVWCGLALIALEAALNPSWRESLGDPQRVPARSMRGALAVVSSVLFLLTQNLWLALVLHWGVSWGLTTLARILPLPACEAERATLAKREA